MAVVRFSLFFNVRGYFKESCRALLRSRDEAVKELVRSSLSEMEMVADLLRAGTTYNYMVFYEEESNF